MINTPKELNDIEVGLYKSGYGFCEKLVKEEHITIGYYQRDLYCFAVNGDFPKITKEAVPLGVSDLTYRVSIMLCMPYAQDIKSVFEVLKGGA